MKRTALVLTVVLLSGLTPAYASDDHFVVAQAERRPVALSGLYVSLGTLHALDLCTTKTALKNGAREINPALSGSAGSTPASIAIKAASAAGTIFFTERMWKKNRKAAVVTMAIINGVTAAVVARNARNARR